MFDSSLFVHLPATRGSRHQNVGSFSFGAICTHVARSEILIHNETRVISGVIENYCWILRAMVSSLLAGEVAVSRDSRLARYRLKAL